MIRPRAPGSTWRLGALVPGAALLLVVLFGGCGAVLNDEAERARLDDDRAVLQQRIAELETALTAVPAAPTPTLSERLILRQFAREHAAPADGDGMLTIELCVEIFGRGDLLAGIPPVLTTSCIPVAVPAPEADAGDPGSAIDAFVRDPVFACWAASAPGVTLPACWP